MTLPTLRPCDTRLNILCLLLVAWLAWPVSSAFAADEPDLIFRRSTVFKLLSPNDKLATYGVDDPRSKASSAILPSRRKAVTPAGSGCLNKSPTFRGLPPIGRSISRARWSRARTCLASAAPLFFKRMQIVRGCDAKRNTLVYMVYSGTTLISGSPGETNLTVRNAWGDYRQHSPEMRRVGVAVR